MQLDIRQISTTVRPLETASDGRAPRVEVAELVELVAAELARAQGAAADRSLRSDDPAGELEARS